MVFVLMGAFNKSRHDGIIGEEGAGDNDGIVRRQDPRPFFEVDDAFAGGEGCRRRQVQTGKTTRNEGDQPVTTGAAFDQPHQLGQIGQTQHPNKRSVQR